MNKGQANRFFVCVSSLFRFDFLALGLVVVAHVLLRYQQSFLLYISAPCILSTFQQDEAVLAENVRERLLRYLRQLPRGWSVVSIGSALMDSPE